MSQLLDLDNISFSVPGKNIVSDISFKLNKGDILTIIGPNGAGKSTLIKIILGLLQQTSGTLTKAENLKIGYMPQKVFIDPTLPITVKRFIRAGKSIDIATIKDTLTQANAAHLLDKSMQVLSGGELQRVLLANAIINKPDLLILDEPAQALDVAGQQHFYEFISHTPKSLNCGIILISHDLHHVIATSDNIICMNVHVCCSGKPEQISNNPLYLEMFAGYIHKHDHHHDGVTK